MFLKKFVFVNWGNIPATEFEFGPINLFSGGNGSGKTTAADAVQTLMTAAHDHLFTFNPGQDEATQRGRSKQVRTLASYVLGCDDGSYARPEGAYGYLAGYFYPTKGEETEPFTALIGCSAIIDRASGQSVARQKDMKYFILPGEQVNLSDLLESGLDGERQVIPMDQLVRFLQKKWGMDRVEHYDTKRQYLRRLYAVLRGRTDAVSEHEAMQAARAFSRFMAYKPVRSITDFVAQEVLEARPMSDAVRTISDLMKTIYAMEAEASRLKKSVELVSQVRLQADQYIDQWIETQRLSFVAALARARQDQKKYLDNKRLQQDIRAELKSVQSKKELAKERRQQVRQHMLQLEAQRQGVDQLKAKDQYDQQVKNAKADISRLIPELSSRASLSDQINLVCQHLFQQLTKSSLSLEVPLLADPKLIDQGKQVISCFRDKEVDLTRLLGADLEGLSALESHLEDLLSLQQAVNSWQELWLRESDQGSVRDQLIRLSDQRQQKVLSVRKQLNQKNAEIQSLRQQQISYPHFVRQAIDAIRKECPEADPRVLCDYVEVDDADWQSAIEGYIGGARFTIVVDSAFESEAIAIVRAMPGRDSRARVLQGTKALADARKVRGSDSSILHLMSFSHATVEAWMQVTYGSVEQVSDRQALAQTRRGLMAEGMGSGGYSMFRCDVPDAELVFGQHARIKALSAKEQEFEQLSQQENDAERSAQEVTDMVRMLNSWKTLDIGDLARQLVKNHRLIQTAEIGLDQLDLSSFDQLQDEFDQQKDKLNTLDAEISEFDREHGELETRLVQLDKKCREWSDLQEQTSARAEEAEQALLAIKPVWPAFDADVALVLAEQEAEQANPEYLTNQLQGQIADLNSLALEIERAVMAHHQHCQQQDRLVIDLDFNQPHDIEMFRQFCLLSQQVSGVYNRLKNNILVSKQNKLADLKIDFSSVFVSNLCQSIFQSINDGKRLLEKLNLELEHHRFGADRETYRFAWDWVPEFKEYWEFFREIVDNASLGESQTLFNLTLSDRSARVRERLLSMLLADDEQKALRELERISDYRNYRSYEIYKQPEGKEPIALSQYGTGSGGQLETPAYIIRSAAITSAFRFDQGNSHLRMVLVDEAFSKMDETRSKEVIHYLTQTLGLQLMFIMPTSKSGPFMDLISNQFVFSKVPLPAGRKIGELNSTVIVDRQVCNQERIADLWAQHRKVVHQQGALDFLEDLA